jgi:hypothetical protein
MYIYIYQACKLNTTKIQNLEWTTNAIPCFVAAESVFHNAAIVTNNP